MVLSTVFEPPDVLIATIDGALTGADQVRLVEWIRAAIRARGTVRVLLRLDRFAGWFPATALDATRHWLRDDEQVEKVAIVGDLRWKRQVLTVAAQPVRRIPIDYFETEAAARTWLERAGATTVHHPAAAAD